MWYYHKVVLPFEPDFRIKKLHPGSNEHDSEIRLSSEEITHRKAADHSCHNYASRKKSITFIRFLIAPNH